MNAKEIETYEQVSCPKCGKIGYTDQRTETPSGYLCTRCANPHIDWASYDSNMAKLKRSVKNGD